MGAALRRVTAELTHHADQQVLKRDLRANGGSCDEPIWWQPEKDGRMR